MVNTELIRVSTETKSILDKLKLTKSETYDEIITRIIKEIKEIEGVN